MFDAGKIEGENKGWKPLKAGLDIPVLLTGVAFREDKDGNKLNDLTFSFKGTAPGNTGVFDFVIWANNFDPTGEYYGDGSGATRTLAQIKHILAGYLTEEECATVVGANWIDFAKAIVNALSADKINRPTFLKVLLKKDKNGRDNNIFPMFPDFLRTDLTPERSFALSTKVNPNTGQPYERIEPMSTAPSPAAKSDDDLFGGEAPAPVFG